MSAAGRPSDSHDGVRDQEVASTGRARVINRRYQHDGSVDVGVCEMLAAAKASEQVPGRRTASVERADVALRLLR